MNGRKEKGESSIGRQNCVLLARACLQNDDEEEKGSLRNCDTVIIAAGEPVVGGRSQKEERRKKGLKNVSSFSTCHQRIPLSQSVMKMETRWRQDESNNCNLEMIWFLSCRENEKKGRENNSGYIYGTSRYSPFNILFFFLQRSRPFLKKEKK